MVMLLKLSLATLILSSNVLVAVADNCAHTGDLCTGTETALSIKDGESIFGIRFNNGPFDQVCYDLKMAQQLLVQHKLIAAGEDVTQFSSDLQKFVTGCEFLGRNPTVHAINSLAKRRSTCKYLKKIAPVCSLLYCQKKFVRLGEELDCNKLANTPKKRSTSYPTYQPVSLGARRRGKYSVERKPKRVKVIINGSANRWR